MPTSSPPGERPSLEAALAFRATPDMLEGGSPIPPDCLVGLTAAEALERLESPGESPRPPLVARLWARLRQAFCGHAAATAHRVPGFGPGLVFERRCGRCGATWSEYG